MAHFIGQYQETNPHENKTLPYQQILPTQANPLANFTIGDWSSDLWSDEVWESEADINASNAEIYKCSSHAPEPTTSCPIEDSDDEEWLGLEHTEADETLSQL